MGDRNSNKPATAPKPLWPWLVVFVLTLMAIYAYDQTLEIIDDLGQMGSDFVQLFKWLWSLVEKK